MNSQFKEIARAYEVLSNEKTRQLYDEGGEEALKEGGPGGGGSGEFGKGSNAASYISKLGIICAVFFLAMDLFDLMFGMGRGRRAKEKRTKDIMYQLGVSHIYC